MNEKQFRKIDEKLDTILAYLRENEKEKIKEKEEKNIQQQNKNIPHKTIQQCINLLETNPDAVCKPQKPLHIIGKIENFQKSYISKWNKRVPAKIILTDDKNNKIEGVIWSNTLEKKLECTKVDEVIITNIYFKRIDERFSNPICTRVKNAYDHRSNETWQFAFHTNSESDILLPAKKND